MIKRLATAMVWILMSAGAAANNAPASDASIREMLEVTNAQQMVAGMKGQVAAVMNTAMQPAQEKMTVIQRESVQELRIRTRSRRVDFISFGAQLI